VARADRLFRIVDHDQHGCCGDAVRATDDPLNRPEQATGWKSAYTPETHESGGTAMSDAAPLENLFGNIFTAASEQLAAKLRMLAFRIM